MNNVENTHSVHADSFSCASIIQLKQLKNCSKVLEIHHRYESEVEEKSIGLHLEHAFIIIEILDGGILL